MFLFEFVLLQRLCLICFLWILWFFQVFQTLFFKSYFFDHVCYRLFFSQVLCFKMMILEEPFERFSLDLLILSRTLIKAYYFFCFIVIVGLNWWRCSDKVFFCPDSGTGNADQACLCQCQKFFKTPELGIVDDLISFVLNIFNWQSTERLLFSDWVSF